MNHEIRDHIESIFFGLSMRQFIFSLLAVAVAVAIYFALFANFGIGTLSWMCGHGAAHFAVAGFSNYHGIGMLVILDSFLNRITQNRAMGRSTFIVIDEIYLLFQHGSWLDMAEIELNVMTRQCLWRRIEAIDKLRLELLSWERDRNSADAKIIWHFKTGAAREKLISLYPSIVTMNTLWHQDG